MENKMRKRAANFTKSEVAALMFLVKKYKTQVDSKLMGTNSNKMKVEAWRKIAQEFNRLCRSADNSRTPFVLRNKYNNIKKIQRMHQARIKKSLQEAAVGQTERDTVENTLGLHNECRDDFDELHFKEENCYDEKVDGEVSPVPNSEVGSLHLDLEKIQTEEVPKRKSPFSDITKEDLLELQKRCFLEEHALKLQHMQEMHDRTLRIQEVEAEEKLKQLREEHQLQLEILQLRKQCLLKL